MSANAVPFLAGANRVIGYPAENQKLSGFGFP